MWARRIFFGLVLMGGLAALIAGRMDDPSAGRVFQIAGLLIVAPIVGFMIWAQLAATHDWFKPIGEILNRLSGVDRLSRRILYGVLLVVAALVSLYGTVWWQGKKLAEVDCKSPSQIGMIGDCDGSTLMDDVVDRVVEKMKQQSPQ